MCHEYGIKTVHIQLLLKVSTPECDLPLDSMLNFSQINGYNCIVIAYIIETTPAFYHWGCLVSALTSTKKKFYQGNNIKLDRGYNLAKVSAPWGKC